LTSNVFNIDPKNVSHYDEKKTDRDLFLMRYVGRITTWKDDKGFGFITISGTKERVFVHISAFENRSLRPAEGDSLTFEIKLDEQHRANAANVRYSDEKNKIRPAENLPLSFSHFFATAYCIVLLALLILGKIPLSVLLVYLFLGAITFITYAIDKSAAQNNKWRTQESTLHIMSLMGGWLGALLAQKKLRHKSKKEEFQRIFWTTVVLNCGAFGWLLTQGYFESWQKIVGF